MRTDRPGVTPDGLYWLSKRSGSDRWQRTWLDRESRQTRRESLGTADAQAAHERLIEWWVANRRLSDERPETVTLAEILSRYYAEHGQGLASASQARIACAMLAEHCGELAVSEFGPRDQRDFIAAMQARGYSAGYIRRTLGVGKTALAWAVRERLIRIAPNVQLPQDGIGRDRVLSDDELAALLIHADEDHLYRFLVLMIATWSRPCALLELHADQIDLDRRRIQLNRPGRQQTKKYRPTVPLVDAALHVVAGPSPAPVRSGPLLTWRGRPLDSIKTAWRRLRVRAGVDADVVPYHVRHTLASQARAAGAPPWEVEGWLGHRRPGTTERYAHFAPDYLGATAAVVQGYLSRLPLRA